MATCVRCQDVSETEHIYCNFCEREMTEEKNSKPKRHTYIHTLQETIADKDAEILHLREMIQDVRCYLALPKFDDDTSVSKYDILTRLGCY